MQQQSGTVTNSRISSLQISRRLTRRLTRPTVASKYSAPTSSVTESGRGSQKFWTRFAHQWLHPPFKSATVVDKRGVQSLRCESRVFGSKTAASVAFNLLIAVFSFPYFGFRFSVFHLPENFLFYLSLTCRHSRQNWIYNKNLWKKIACSRCDKQFHEECAYTFERETLLATVIQ